MKNLRQYTLVFFLWTWIGILSAWSAEGNYAGKPFFQNFPALEYKGHNRNFDVACDSTGRVFVANFEGLMVYDGADWQMIHTPGISRVTRLYRAKDGRMWFGGYNVLGYLEENDKPLYVVCDTTQTTNMGEVSYIDEHDGAIRFCTIGNQKYEVREGKVQQTDAPDFAPSQEKDWNGMIVKAEEPIDDQELTALATAAHGVVILDNKGKICYTLTTDDGLCSNSITDLSYDGKGSLWGATDNGLFVIHLSPVYSHYSESDGLYGQVTSILKVGDGLCVGTLQGLFLLGANDRFERVEGMAQACWQLVPAPEGGMWAAMAEGLYKYDKKLVQITPRHTLSVTALDNKSFLTGELDGIYYHTSSGVDSLLAPIPNVVKFVRKKDHTLWAITLYRETYCMKEGKRQFERKENNELTLLFEHTDKRGNYWHSDHNNQGLFCDGLSENLAVWSQPLGNYSIQAMEQEEGMAWVGGNFGLIRFDIIRMTKMKAYPPRVFVRQFSMQDSNVQYTVALDKTDPIGNSMYSYRLQKDGNWSEWSPEQHHSFSHLAPGEYELTVRAMDAHGQMVESEKFSFDIPIPFFLRWYALLTYALVIVLAFYLWFRWRMIRAQMEQQRLEHLVNKRTRELKDAQKQLLRQEREATVGKLTKGLIDRILNPMNYINNFSHLSLGLAKDLKENLEDEEEKMTEDIYEDSMDVIEMMRSNMEKIEQHGLATTRILKAMEELLKDHSGKIEPANLTPLCQQSIEKCLTYYAQEIEQYHIQVKWETPQLPIVADVNAANLSQVIMSMLNNSFYALQKKAQKGDPNYQPMVELKLKPRSGTEPPTVVIYDNGIGIESTIIDKVFDPFFTTKPTAEAPGVGLYLSQQVVQDMGGSIQVKSEKDQFTEFSIQLP